MSFDSLKNLAAIAIILLWVSAFGASLGDGELFGVGNVGLNNVEQAASLDSPQQTLFDLDVKSVISVATGAGDTRILPARRVSATATLWLVCLGLALIVIGGLRRHK